MDTGVYLSVGSDDAVSIEEGVTAHDSAGVIGRLNPDFLFIIVCTVKPHIFAVFIYLMDSLVNEVPDITAAEVVVLLESIHILLEVTQ